MADEESLKESKSCWKNRTWLEIALIVLTSLMALFILGSFGIDFRMLRLVEEPEPDVCITPECVKTATEVLARIDQSVDPCEDFYLFSCGTFIKNQEVPDFNNFKSEISTFSITNDLVEKQLRCLLEQDIEKDEAKPYAMLKSLYKSCMDVEKINAHSMDTFKMWLEKSGGWPVLDGNLWDEENFDLKNALDIICENSIMFDNIFFEMRVDKDPEDNEKKMLFIDQPVSRRNFVIDLLWKGLSRPLAQDYYEYMIDVAAFLGAPKVRAAKEMRDVIDFEIELVKILDTVLNESGSKKTRVTLHELQKSFGFVDWLTHINKMIYPAKKRRTNDEVIVINPSYFKNLESLLQDTPKKTIANYMHWILLYYVSPYLHEDLRNMNNELNSKIFNITIDSPRWMFCANQGPFLAMMALYSRYYLTNDSSDAVQEMTEGIKTQFSVLIEETEWMDDVTKEKALKKAENADVLIDYPDEFQDDEVLEEHYKNLDIDPENYLESMHNIAIFNKQQMYSELDEPLDDTDWRKGINLFRWSYHTVVHDTGGTPVTLPVTAFQGISFHNDRPRYMNYGSIGFVIGNKLTHSIHRPEVKDEETRIDWWQSKTRTAFKDKTDCIHDQDEDSKLDDKDGYALISTVVSMAAVKEAYLAYKNWTEINWEEEALPGLEYTPGQLFWISLGNMFCSVTNSDESKWKSSVLFGDNRHFVNVLAMNSEHFSENFECSEDSKMNPKKKCKVW